MSIGIFAAFGALLCWTFGDFLIQKSVRKIGVTAVLTTISISAAIILFPFIHSELAALFANTGNLVLLSLAALVFTFASFFDFKALREGKLAIVEPILGAELLVTVGLSVAILHEYPSLGQGILMVLICAGIVLAVTEHRSHLAYHRRIFEKGALLAGLGAIVMGLTNFLVGVGSGEVSPVMTMWFISTFIGIVCILYIVFGRGAGVSLKSIRQNTGLIIVMCILDNAAWLFYAVATKTIPISTAITISESYIALTVLLGVFVNKERIRIHQKMGIAVAVIGTIILSVVS